MNENANVKLNPWHPMKNPVDLKTLGKLAEELGEAQSVVARCIIQGIDEYEPETKKLNRRWLEDEIADVGANIQLVIQRFNLDMYYIIQRRDRKRRRLEEWHRMA